jgi:hypothetical protein
VLARLPERVQRRRVGKKSVIYEGNVTSRLSWDQIFRKCLHKPGDFAAVEVLVSYLYCPTGLIFYISLLKRREKELVTSNA